MDADVASVAGLLADPARVRMLDELLAGRAHGRVPRGLVLTDAGRDGLAGSLACHVPTPRRA